MLTALLLRVLVETPAPPAFRKERIGKEAALECSCLSYPFLQNLLVDGRSSFAISNDQ